MKVFTSLLYLEGCHVLFVPTDAFNVYTLDHGMFLSSSCQARDIHKKSLHRMMMELMSQLSTWQFNCGT